MKTEDYFRGRLEEDMGSEVKDFLSSREPDKEILESDLEVIEAHCLMLYKQDLLDSTEIKIILDCIENLREEEGKEKLQKELGKSDYVDVHPFLEDKLIEKCGMEVGGKTHTAKSRNDQVMVDAFLYLRRKSILVAEELLTLAGKFIELAEEEKESIMPSYTHQQHAQVTTLGHYFLSYVDVFAREIERILNEYKNVNLNPLGAGAIAGSSLPIDRKYVAELLGFDGVLENSIDAISNRDIMLNYGFNLSAFMTTLNRIGTDFSLWSSYEFRIMDLSDEFADTSTSMPQKKNPDTLEMITANNAQILGSITGCISTLSKLPTGYSRDLQEVRVALQKIINKTIDSIRILRNVVSTASFDKDRMKELVKGNHVLALDLAELLVTKNIPFRKAHWLTGEIIKELSSENTSLLEIGPEGLKRKIEDHLEEDINVSMEELEKVTDPVSCIRNRKSLGSPAPSEIRRMIDTRKKKIGELEEKISEKKNKIKKANERKEEIKTKIKNGK